MTEPTNQTAATSPPTPAERATAEATKLMADPNSGYADRTHPKYEATNARVKELWRTVAGAPSPPPEPSVSPSLVDPLDRVPADARGYRLDPPQLADDRAPWDQGMLAAFPAVAHAAKLTPRQAQQTLVFAARTILPALIEHGEQAFDLLLPQKWETFTRLYGIPPEAGRALAEWFLERLGDFPALPPRGTDPALLDLKEERAAIMSDMNGPYYNKAHPKHHATMERVHHLSQIITRKESRR